MRNRTALAFLKDRAESRFGRIVVLTGARQTGKTTLVRLGFPEHEYISLEDPVVRPAFTGLSAAQWHRQYPVAILDEVQKAPSLIESVKATYDQYPDTRHILLGSSQILLLKGVRESLAGRASLVELYPLTLPESLTDSWEEEIQESRLVRWLREGATGDQLVGIPQREERFANAKQVWDGYLRFGAMPALSDAALAPEEKYEWLGNYIQTYLQRDVRDLANLRDLEPFVRAQKALATLTGRLLNTSGLARRSGISGPTAKRFITYLEISYQIILLQPWFRNLGKRLVKSPRVHFIDPGVQRALLGRRGEPTGEEFESAVVAEVYKQVNNARLPVHCHHLRTVDGREIDLLLECDEGFVPIEIKMAERVAPADARHLRNLDAILDKPVLHALLMSNDPRAQVLDKGITAVPAAWMLS
ncbi:MAG: ATP-binding protein [Candidatus Latescibacteria bacterium]|jgi:hypothetical protein|nr:ATP-binding protein [Candidatus Latescibacterota bacterium]